MNISIKITSNSKTKEGKAITEFFEKQQARKEAIKQFAKGEISLTELNRKGIKLANSL